MLDCIEEELLDRRTFLWTGDGLLDSLKLTGETDRLSGLLGGLIEALSGLLGARSGAGMSAAPRVTMAQDTSSLGFGLWLGVPRTRGTLGRSSCRCASTLCCSLCIKAEASCDLQTGGLTTHFPAFSSKPFSSSLT